MRLACGLRRYHDPDSFHAAISPKTKAIFVELIANPGGIITDIEAIAKIAKEAGVPLIVDNTLATPYLISPIEHGADIIVHSLTKFLGGHGNSMGGAIVDGGKFDWSKSGRYPTLLSSLHSYHGIRLHETFGNIAFAIACPRPWIARSRAVDLATQCLPDPDRNRDTAPAHAATLRQRAHGCQVAEGQSQSLLGQLCRTLGSTSIIRSQKKYSPKGAGAVFTFGLKGGYDEGVKVVSNVKLLSHLANIGDTRSLIIHPASTTHRQLSDEDRIKAGAGPDVVRLSVGIEDRRRT